jgi:hypothetical protein
VVRREEGVVEHLGRGNIGPIDLLRYAGP